MGSRAESESREWAYRLADHGASARVIAEVCGRTRRWARKIVADTGATNLKRRTVVNRERTFELDAPRRAHTHVVLRVYFASPGGANAPERLWRVYTAYRSIVRGKLFGLDEVHELVDGVVAEGAVVKRVCGKCGQGWYQISAGWIKCPACEEFQAYTCKACGTALPVEEPENGAGFAPRRGRPRDYCDNCSTGSRRGRQRLKAQREADRARQVEIAFINPVNPPADTG